MTPRTLIVGTRGSALAMTQTESVVASLRALHPGLEIRVQRITTKGDVMRDVPLARIGGRGVFVDAIEDAINAYRTSLSNDLKRKTYTIGVELGNLAFDGQRRWSVSSSDDRAPAERQV